MGHGEHREEMRIVGSRMDLKKRALITMIKDKTGRMMSDMLEEPMKPKPIKSVCVQVDEQHRDMLAHILSAHKRTLKGQIELWIEQEQRILDLKEVSR